MDASEVVAVVRRLQRAEVPCWISGGWGIEALLEGRHRAHDDLDLVFNIDDLSGLRAALPDFVLVLDAQPGWPVRLELQDLRGSKLDAHPLRFDDAGTGWHEVPGNGTFAYPATDLAQSGELDGEQVLTLSAALQLRMHSGYEPDLIDWWDVTALCRQQQLSLPPELEMRPTWIHFRRKAVVTATLGHEPTWRHIDRHRLEVPEALNLRVG